MPTNAEYPSIDDDGRITVASRWSALLAVIIFPSVAGLAWNVVRISPEQIAKRRRRA